MATTGTWVPTTPTTPAGDKDDDKSGNFIKDNLVIIVVAVAVVAVVIVGVMMASALKEIDWSDISVAIPAFFTVIGMPLFYSITDGIAFGFITFVIVKIASKKIKEIHPIMFAVVALFLLKYVISVL